MKTAAVKDKHLRLDETKIKKAKAILKTKTETETIEKALEFVISTDTKTVQRNEISRSILMRKERLQTIKGDVADWVREGRTERDHLYGG